jgi:hypothetical protein
MLVSIRKGGRSVTPLGTDEARSPLTMAGPPSLTPSLQAAQNKLSKPQVTQLIDQSYSFPQLLLSDSNILGID